MVNNKRVILLEELPEKVTQLSLMLHPAVRIKIPKHQEKAIKKWLNILVDRVQCDYVSYNGVLIPKGDLRKAE